MQSVLPIKVGPSSHALDTISKKEDRNLRCHEALLIFIAVAAPNLALVTLCSDLGFGLKFYSALAPENRNLAGNGILAFASFLACFVIALDWIRWKRINQAWSLFLVVYLIVVGAILKAKWYPQAPLVILMLHVPCLLGGMRLLLFASVKRNSFYYATTASLIFVGCVCLGVWLAWILVDGFDGKNEWNKETKLRLVKDSEDIYKEFEIEISGSDRAISYVHDCDKYTRLSTDYVTGDTLSSQEKSDRGEACAQVKTIWFLAWMAPFICFGCDFIMAAFCIINGIYLDPDMSKLEKVLKRFVLMVAVVVICMWCSASVGAASMRLSGTLMAFCGAGLLILVAWVFLRLGLNAISQRAAQSKSMKTFIALAQSDWSRACVVIGMNVLMPIFLAVNILNQKVRRARGDSPDHDGLFTKEVEPIVQNVMKWSWGSIFIKANRLNQLYFVLSIGVAKITYVFLAWLNETLLKWSMLIVLLTFFAIGFTMFMLPPVPGIPVYICSGIVIGARARTTSIGYGGGICVAVGLSFVLKLIAVAGQYTIGILAGKSVAVQKFVGVDKVPIRAIEMILKTKGINLPKVAVLVGGPDWPTSVLCGILRLNLFQCILGTTPVILVSSPCVLAGAFMSGPNEPSPENAGEKGIWDTLASSMLGASALCQLASGVLALYFTQEVMYQCGEELAAPRQEHEAIAELTRKEAARVECYCQVIDWKTIPTILQCILASSTFIQMMSTFVFTFMGESCFRDFQVSNRIGDDWEDFGLNNDPVSIVRPLGRIGLIFFAAGCLLDFIFCKWASMTTSSRMKAGFTPVNDITVEPAPPVEPKNAW